MTTIDLTKSQFLFPLLQKMLSGLTQLSTSDTTLNEQVYQLHHFLSNPREVDGEALLSTLDETKDLASSYEDVKGTDARSQEVAALPSIFHAALTEAEHLVKSKQLMEMPGSKTARIELEVDRFYSLATGR